ncbi:MAG: hypothetical protein ACK4F9_02380 [Brevinematia bacterium]
MKFVILLQVIFVFVLFSCSQVPEVSGGIDVYETNYTTNYQTNYSYTSNTNVSFYLVNIQEGSIVQPFFLVKGVLANGATSSDVYNLYIYITNNGFSNSGQFDVSNFSLILSAQGHDNIYVYVTLISKYNSSYVVGLNLKVSNIPIVEITNFSSNFIVTTTDVTFSGYVDVSTPDDITNVSIIISNANGLSTNVVSTNVSTSWTNVVKRVLFSSTPSLAGGYNYVKVIAVSSVGIVGQSETITVLKSMFVIDGSYEPLWNNTKLVATSSSVNPYFNWGLGSIRVTNDSYFLYIFVSNLSVPNLGDNGLKLSVSIDTNSTSGLSNDAWVGYDQPGRFVYQPTNGNYPDIQIHIRLKQSNQVQGAGVYVAVVGSTNYWSNVANTWVPGMDGGVMFGLNNQVGWEIAVPLGVVGITNGMIARFIAVLGQQDVNDKNSAIHVLPESPSNEITTNNGYFTNVIRVWSDDYSVN